VPGFVTSRNLRTSIQPREFWDRIKDLPDFDAKDVAWDLDEGRKPLGKGLEKDGCREWIRYLMRKDKGWFAIARELIETTNCDLLAVIFEGIDRLQHQTWRLLDPAFIPENPTPIEQETRNNCLDYFRQLDQLVQELVELAGEESQVFMVSDHGFGPTNEIFYVNVLLEKNGFLTWKNGVSTDDKGLLTAHNMREHFETIDWEKTVAYARTTSANGIYIRVARKSGQPGIAPEEYNSVRSQLVDLLLSYKDQQTGTPVVTKIETREEVFPGIAMGQAPDLTLTLRDGGFVSILKSDTIIRPRPEVKGTHRPEGIFLASGHGVRNGLTLNTLSVLDVTPTLLYSMGLPIPEDLEGRVATDAFTPEYLESYPIGLGRKTQDAGDASVAVKSERLAEIDQAQIMERLKALGYLE
jgi:predicted AlkP superfamily phosphohydrolase/phosphomutase